MKTTRRIVPVSALRDNYVWALCAEHCCALVDPGEAAPVLSYLASENLRPSAILLTHRHKDHTDGVAELCRAYGSIPVYGNKALPQVSIPVADGERLPFPGIEDPIEVMAVPGHTEEHLAFLWGDALFCGDTLFGAGCGRIFDGTPEQMHQSLQRLARLPAMTKICCAHEYTLANLAFAAVVEPGNAMIANRLARCTDLRAHGLPTLPSTLQEELATNPFLRCQTAEVRHAAETHAGHPLDSAQEVFAALRSWKDQFPGILR